ncbi:MAG: TlpA disulfide reductase family protein [Eubacteriales bacterium]|nr:TlpA disulfide reductase family protein [Eubacteriales bacterium]
MRAPDFTAPLYGTAGGDFVLSETRGKVVVINFWATWCTPCCAELPYFQQIYEKYPDDVALVALHSSMVTDDVQAYLDKQGYSLPFALDTDGSIIRAFGGSTSYPMTVVLDRQGKIVYNKEGPATFELLESLISPLL